MAFRWSTDSGQLKLYAYSEYSDERRRLNKILVLVDLFVIFYLPYREVTSENRSLPWVEERFAILDRNRLKKEKEEKLRLEVQLRWTLPSCTYCKFYPLYTGTP